MIFFGIIIDCGCLLDQKATVYRANEPTKVPDLPAEVKPPNRLKYYNLELKLKIKNDRESRRKVEAAAKRRYSSLGYGLPQVRIIKVLKFISLNDLNLTFQFSFRLQGPSTKK